jgi:polyphenol oxidase
MLISAPAISAPDLAALPGIAHAFFTREGGVSDGLYTSLNGGLGSGDDRANVLENRARMSAALGVAPDHLVSVHQVHSPDAVHVTGPWANDRPKADGMFTATPGLALGVLTADCGPILFADAEARVIGACHAGWKGAFTGVIEATLAGMETLGAKRARITAVLGPTISRTAYEVGPEFSARIIDADADNARFFTPSPKAGHAMFDLPAYIAQRMAAAGIDQFVDLALCTYADPQRFFSYRRTVHRSEPDYGRLVSAIALTSQS